MEQRNVVIYARYSSSNQSEQSIEGQLHVCEDFCKREGYTIVGKYIDRATSASKDLSKRTEFLQMIKDSDKRDFEAVIVYKLDRFARNRYDSANFKYKLRRNGVALISATENISNDPEGIILESVLEGMAEFYSAELSQKVRRGRAETAAKRNSYGGNIPLGFKVENKKLVIDEPNAKIVRLAFSMFADDTPIVDICRLFNAKRYKTSKGGKFNKNSFHRMFQNEKYIGVYKYKDEVRDEGAIPAIIDKDTWDIVQSKLHVKKPRNNGEPYLKNDYLLTGKIFCGHCESPMYAATTNRMYKYYYCAGKRKGSTNCNKKSVNAKVIEPAVIKDAMALLTDEYIDRLADIAVAENQKALRDETTLMDLRKSLKEVNASLNNLLKAVESGTAPDIIVKRMAELEKEKKVIEKEIKNEQADVVELDKAMVVYFLNQFRNGDPKDPDFCRNLVNLFVNAIYVWDEPDGGFKITIAYNLTDRPNKTYRLKSDGMSEVLSSLPDAPPYVTGITPKGVIISTLAIR